jgi:hypothetical protein
MNAKTLRRMTGGVIIVMMLAVGELVGQHLPHWKCIYTYDTGGCNELCVCSDGTATCCIKWGISSGSCVSADTLGWDSCSPANGYPSEWTNRRHGDCFYRPISESEHSCDTCIDLQDPIVCCKPLNTGC